MKKHNFLCLEVLCSAFLLSSCGPEISSLLGSSSSNDASSSNNNSSSSSLTEGSSSSKSNSSSESSGDSSSKTSEGSSSSSSGSSSSIPEDKDLLAPTGLKVESLEKGISITFQEVDGATSYLVYAYQGESLLDNFPRSISNGAYIGHFSSKGTYSIQVAAKKNGTRSPLSEAVEYVENLPSSSISPSIPDDKGSGTELPAPRDINVTDIGYAWQLQFTSGETLNPGVTHGHEVGYRLFALYADGGAVEGYPRAIDLGYSFPKFPSNGTYYVYLQAIGDGTSYSNSSLTPAIKIEEKNAFTYSLPDPKLTTNGGRDELPAPSGLQMGVTKAAIVETESEKTVYRVTYTTTDKTILLYCVDTLGNIVSGYPRSVGNGENIDEVTENGTFFFFIQAKGGTYDGKTYGSSAYSYVLSLERKDGENVITSGSKYPSGGIAIEDVPSTIKGSLNISGIQDGARNIIYYIYLDSDPFIGDKLRAGTASIETGVTGSLGTDWHIVHSSFFDHACWYVNVHTGQVIDDSMSFSFEALIKIGSDYYYQKINSWIR